jgi:hypothetical protein
MQCFINKNSTIKCKLSLSTKKSCVWDWMASLLLDADWIVGGESVTLTWLTGMVIRVVGLVL